MLKIYLTDLAAYNKGLLYGEWISLPCDNLQEELRTILHSGEVLCFLKNGYYEKHEEWFVTDYEWDTISLFSVAEYIDIFKLNEDVKHLASLSTSELKAFRFLIIENLADNCTQALELIDNVVIYESTTIEEIAYNLIEECYNLDSLPIIISSNLDYSAIARDLIINGNYVIIDDDIYEYLG